MKKLLLLPLSLGLSTIAFSQGTFESSGSASAWSSATSWTLVSGSDADGIPDSDDAVSVLAGHAIIVSSDEAASTLEIHDDGSISELTIDLGNTLTVGGNVGLNIDAEAAEIYLEINGTLVCSGTFRALIDENDAAVEMTIGASGLLDINNAGTSFFRINSATTDLSFLDNLGTVDCDGSFEFRSTDGSFIEIDNTGDFIVDNDFRIRTDDALSSLTFENKNLLDIGVDLDLRSRTDALPADLVLDMRYNGSQTNLGNVIQQLNEGGTVSASSLDAEFIYDGTTQTVSSDSRVTYHDLTISSTTSGDLDADIGTGNLIGDLTISSGGTFNQGTFTVGVGEDVINNGTLTQSAALTVAGNYDNNTGATHNLTATCTIEGNLTTAGTSNFNINGANLDVEGNVSNAATISTTGSGGEFQIGGNYDHLGTLSMLTADALVMDGGSGTNTISGTFTLPRLTIDHAGTGVTNSGNITVTHVLDIDNGTFTTGGNVTLNSDGTSTGQLADITGGDISGTMTVERQFVTAQDGWREFTSPVNTVFLSDMMADGIIMSGFTNSTFPNFSFTSAYSYEENNANGDKDNGWVAATDADTNTVRITQAYRCYVGTGTFSVSNTGTPVKNTVTFLLDYQDDAGGSDEEGWNFIGSPYPCTVDWDHLGESDIKDADNEYHIFSGDAGNYGVYVGGTPGGLGTNGTSRYLPHTNGIWVHATASGASITFNEDDKAPEEDAAFVKSTSTLADLLSIRLTGDVNSYSDQALIVVNDTASMNYAANEDGLKLHTPIPDAAPSLSLVAPGGIEMSFNRIDRVSSFSIPVHAIAGTLAQGNYTLEFENLDLFMPGSCVMLEDLHTGTMSDLRQSPSYTYVSSDTTSQARFMLHMTTAIATAKENASCYGSTDGMAIAEVSNGSTYDLVWRDAQSNPLQTSNGVSGADTLFNLGTGFYTLEPFGGSCKASNVTVFVDQPVEVIADFTPSADTVYLSDGGTVEFSNLSNGSSSYLWDFDDNNTSNANEPLHAYSAVGIYQVSLTAHNGNVQCDHSISKPVTVLQSSSPTGIEETLGADDIDIYYNGNAIVVSFDLDEVADAKVRVLNLLGQDLMTPLARTVQTNTVALNELEMAKGVYLVSVELGEETITKRLVIGR